MKNVLCYGSHQNIGNGIGKLVKHWVTLRFPRSPASGVIQGVVKFVDWLAEKLRYVFSLHIKINELAKSSEK